MTFLEAKTHAFCNTINEIFEESYQCEIPKELKEEFLKDSLEKIKPLQKWLESL